MSSWRKERDKKKSEAGAQEEREDAARGLGNANSGDGGLMNINVPTGGVTPPISSTYDNRSELEGIVTRACPTPYSGAANMIRWRCHR